MWCNRQTEPHIVLRPKPRNRRGDFEAQIGKPSTTLVLRLNQETHHRFEAKPGETVATSFEAKLEKTIATGFEAKPEKTIAAGFEFKPLETVATTFEAKSTKLVRVVLRPNHSQTMAIGFEAQTNEKPS
jgi:hypothetical protein